MLLTASLLATVSAAPFPWQPTGTETLESRLAPPEGFARVAVDAGSFGAFLRALPLKPDKTPVHLFDGRLKPEQGVHTAVIDIDVGTKDLQQCADAVIRLRAEYLFDRGDAGKVSFPDTAQGKPIAFKAWAKGERPSVQRDKLVWKRSAKPDEGYASFRSYLDTVFMWAGTASLERWMTPVKPEALRIGDVVIKGGFPGHAVLIVDEARNAAGERRVLLAQSYMPAQDLHVLKSASGSAWFKLPSSDAPYPTPEWTFPPGSTRTWPAEGL